MNKTNYDLPIQFTRYIVNNNVLHTTIIAILWENIVSLEEYIPESSEYFNTLVDSEAIWIMLDNDHILVKGKYTELLKEWEEYCKKVRIPPHTPNYKIR
jgi:hypothetical protein